MPGIVICGVGEGGNSRAAVRVARHLSESLGCSLLLVHVVPAEDRASFRSRSRDESPTGSGAEILLAEIAIEEELGGSLERRVLFGSPAHELIALADYEQADLIVVGASTRSRLHAISSSLPCTLARRAPCPVVVVPAPARAQLANEWSDACW